MSIRTSFQAAASRLRSIRIAGLACVGAFVLAAGASANNVQALREGSLLKIRGDSAGNHVVISQNAANDVIVTGQNGTTVNGRPSVRFLRMDLNALDIRMEGGNDRVTLSNLDIGNDLFVNLGSGTDRLLTGNSPSIVGANATVEGGSGYDTVNLTDLIVFEDLYINGQTGPLVVRLLRVEVDKNLTIIGDLVDDEILVSRTTVGDTTSIETKEGDDRVTVLDHAGFDLSINTDKGNDTVNLDGAIISEDIEATTGPGNDSVTFIDVSSGKNIKVSLDVGTDSFTGRRVSARFDAVFEGGDGFDTFGDFGITGGTKKEVKEFERFLR